MPEDDVEKASRRIGILEAPRTEQQAWFVRTIGSEVNLGNIPPEEVIALETLRLGLRGDTLREILLAEGEKSPAPAGGD